MNPTTVIDTAPADVGPPQTPRRRQWPARMVVVFLVLAGVVVTSWPIGTTYVEDYGRTREALAVAQATARAPLPMVAQALAQAGEYNATLGPETLRDPWTERGAEGSADQDQYLSQLALFPAMGTLVVPRIRTHLPISHNATGDTLAHGVGHFFGSSLPTGGRGNHAVLAGHSGMSYGTLFDRLPELEIGDRFEVHVYGEVLTYRVNHIEKVLPTELDAIRRVPGKDYVTLLTCVPRVVNTYRLLVRGVRVPDAPATPVAASATESVDLTVREWMVPRLALSVGALALLGLIVLGWIVGDARRRRARRVASADTTRGPL